MHTVSGHTPEKQIELGFPRKVVTMPAYDWTYAPTLAAIHDWMWGDYGMLYYSWHDGWLCPFHSSIGERNMRCVAGNRGIRQCPGIGMLADDYIDHWPEYRKRQFRGRVICYSWGHLLGLAYWDYVQAHQNEHLAQPDENARWIAVEVLRNTRRSCGWDDWRKELRLRQQLPRYKRRWLQRLEPGNINARS
jgi:hypothetical protein